MQHQHCLRYQNGWPFSMQRLAGAGLSARLYPSECDSPNTHCTRHATRRQPKLAAQQPRHAEQGSMRASRQRRVACTVRGLHQRSGCQAPQSERPGSSDLSGSVTDCWSAGRLQKPASFHVIRTASIKLVQHRDIGTKVHLGKLRHCLDNRACTSHSQTQTQTQRHTHSETAHAKSNAGVVNKHVQDLGWLTHHPADPVEVMLICQIQIAVPIR